MALSCAEMIDEIQARVGRPGTTVLIDTTFLTRRINEGQKTIAEQISLIPSLVFKNTTSLDTTGTITYNLSDISAGDYTSQPVCHVTDVWYLDGNETRRLTFKPTDEFDQEHPDPTHSDEHFAKPAQWTLRNRTIEMYPYCASSYWNKNIRVDGDFYPREFSTDSTNTSDISRSDEGLILYGVWQAWKAIGIGTPGVQVQAIEAEKAFSNPEPSYGENYGWLEQFRNENEKLIAWSGNFYDNKIF